MSDTFRTRPRNDGTEEDCQCARCGGSCEWIDCDRCGGDGTVEDDGWDGCAFDEWTDCGDCNALGGWQQCGNSYEWCQAHPMPGREHVESGTIEWYDLPARHPVAGGRDAL